MYAPERDELVKSAAALGPAASYLCTPEAHGNAPSPPAEVAGQCDVGTTGGGGLRGKTRGERKREIEGEGKKNKGKESYARTPSNFHRLVT